ncbi:DUF2892 domain-containing protein [Candidatus Woesearchaeota archaeon]|nr:DUF2892 domain-containing protein [Candidatus Woesearchaeota archaeon]
MCKQNLGKLDRTFRFVLAIWWMSAWAPSFSNGWANLAVYIIAWIALIEAFAGYCPLHDWCGINNKNQ